MSQVVSAGFAAQNASANKSVDCAIVIAGWPTVYTVVKNNYALAGDFVNFTSIQSWADIPVAAGAVQKGRPEEGGLTIGQADVTILDRRSNGVRQLSDLLSRQAYLTSYNADPAKRALLTGDITNEQGTINAGPIDPTFFPISGGLLYIGQECIRYTSHNGSSFTGCTRGYLLTSATPHKALLSAPLNWNWLQLGIYGPAWLGLPTGQTPLTVVYPFMPSLHGRKAFIYKGYQSLGLDQWARAFGGVVVGAVKKGAAVTLSMMSSTWNTYGDGQAFAFGAPPANPYNPYQQPFGSLTLINDVLSGDFRNIAVHTAAPTANWGNGHYLINIAGSWNGIVQVNP